MTRTRVSPPGPRSKTVDTTDDDGWPVLAPTLLTIERTSPEDVKVRQIIVSLDGKLRANNTLVWRTVAFDAEPGTTVRYTCVNRAPASLYFMLFLFGVAPLYVTLERGTTGH